jgi:hypothetical protein
MEKAMSVRPPNLQALRRRSDYLIDPMQAEILAEKAAALGHHGRQVERALQALRTFEGDPEERLALVKHAAREVWAFLVQRELCGLRDQKEVIRHYAIPPEVMVRLGVMEK